MAVAVTVVEQTDFGNKRVNRVTIALDNSYPTSGYAVTAANCGLTTLDELDIAPSAAGATALYFEFVSSTSKIKAYSGAAQVANATDLSAATVVRAMAYGS